MVLAAMFVRHKKILIGYHWRTAFWRRKTGYTLLNLMACRCLFNQQKQAGLGSF